MPRRSRKAGTVWQVTVVGEGRPAEAEAVAVRVRQMVAGWVLGAAPGGAESANAGSSLPVRHNERPPC